MRRPLFETAVVARPRRQLLTLPISIFLHGVIVSALVLVPYLTGAELPVVSVGNGTIFELPVVKLAPPPPAPSPRGDRSKAHQGPEIAKPSSGKLVVPTDVPKDIDVDKVLEGLVAGSCKGLCVIGGDPNADPTREYTPVVAVPSPKPAEIPVRVSEYRAPRKLHDVPPMYPAIALPIRLQGDVRLDCVIGTDGRVRDVTVLSGNPILAEAAVEAVRQWIYLPTLMNGVPVPVILSVTVRFRINSR